MLSTQKHQNVVGRLGDEHSRELSFMWRRICRWEKDGMAGELSRENRKMEGCKFRTRTETLSEIRHAVLVFLQKR